ncbi:Glutamate-1-semialdehyde aminotransferase [Nostoc flagelliforme CCNUN1]|uniref:Glutamate-1-semialdehyde aminotransferase n=1 Tax=Nostoc flagelliforme CCNUN1 TaxID=2038116 RepID=A0A2K8T1P1_9NOSO|nr:non-ribosomal peptide synthetase [Nostoc flagelliforme]AUB41617.1 Glutamate-1-semialdehyde aminotransferase [Nostoc flagelliforme CCNUN1]
MKTIEKFLSYLCSQDIKLWIENNRLRCSAPKEALTPDIKAELAARKAEILAFISQANQVLQSTSESIQPASHQENVPLSFAQQRLWFFTQLEPDSSAYNIPAAVRLTGKLNVSALSKSINEIIRRHEILRTTFTVVDGEPIQVIGNSHNFHFAVIDLQTLAEDEKQQEVLNLAALEAQKPFDLVKGPLIRASLIKLAETDYVVLLTMHHIVSDGWSAGILIKELTTLYTAFCQGQPSPLPKLPIQYADFAIWQRKWLQGEVLQSQLSYWKQQLGSSLPILELPSDRPRPAIQSNNGASQPFQLSKSLTEKLKDLSQQEGVTLFMTLLAAFKVLLYRYTQQEDIIVGSPIANRNRSDIEGLIGFFVNTLVLRTNLSNNPNFKKLLQQVREVTLGAYAHQDLPFERLVEELQPGRNLSHSPLFQVMFVLQNAATEVIQLPDLTLKSLTIEKNTAKFDITLSLSETKVGLQGDIEYNTDIFNSDTITRILGHFQVLLEEMVTNPEKRISELSLLTANEQYKLLVEWNNTQIEYSRNQCIHQLFEAQVRKNPDAVAVVFNNECLTYQELNQRANQLARLLMNLGANAGDFVGILKQRDINFLIAILAIFKVGGAYVPIDSYYPQDRINYMVANSEVKVILTDFYCESIGLLKDCPYLKYLIFLDIKYSNHTLPPIENLEIYGQLDFDKLPKENLKVNNTILDPAYMIYTSGSTGLPKGAIIRHIGAINHIYAQFDALELDEKLNFLQSAPASSDISVWQFLAPIIIGGKTTIIDTLTVCEPEKLFRIIKDENITIVELVPSVILGLLEYICSLSANERLLVNLKWMMLTGESAPVGLVNQWLQLYPSIKVVNAYGPTEAADDITQFIIDKPLPDSQRTVPIGKPLANLNLYILDSQIQLLPIGVPGEICVSGFGVGLGYWRNEASTKSSFIPNPFITNAKPLPGTDIDFIYKTGDLGRWLPDGNIEFLGRIDHQVKIRGFRIEVGEIETLLTKHPEIQESVIAVKEDDLCEKRLVAYVVPKQNELSTNELASKLRKFLQPKLPDYMIPSAFVLLEALPLTPNGKIDRRALPAPNWSQRTLEQNYISPRTPVEEIIANAWTQVLGLKQVGVNDNFFDLGGHSLLATQLISRLRQIFQIELPLQKIFELPTVTGLATAVEAIKQAQDGLLAPPIVPVTTENHLPLSFAQQRLWFLEQLQPNNAAYNINEAVRVLGSLNLTALEASLNEIIERHEALRTAFIAVEGLPMQVITANLQLSLPVINLEALSKLEQETQVQQIIHQETQKPFDLSQLPLLRVIVLQLSSTEYVVIFTMHHIISDTWSMGVIIREIVALYPAFAEGKPFALPELPIQYADFAVWQRQWLQGQVLENHLAYWKQKLGAALPVLKLPYSQHQAANPSNQAGVQTFNLSTELSQALKTFSRQENVTLFMTMVAALKTLLYSYTGQDDIVIGTDVANRNRGETEDLIGFFVNLLVLRTDISGYPTFRELLQRVRKVTLEAYNYQDLSFDKLVEELRPERHLSNTPLFQVLFVMDNVPTQNLQLPGLTLSPIEVETKTAKFDIALFMSETESGIIGSWLYKKDLFVAEKLVSLFDNLPALLASITTQTDARINTLDLLTETQKQEHLQTEAKQEQGKLKKLMKVKPKAIKLSE